MTGDRGKPGEFDLIASVFAPLTGGDERALGLLDDAAILPQTEGRDTVVTTDTMVAGIHFLESETADVVARRLLRVNLSDLASMGAEPVAYFLNMTLPPGLDEAWVRLFADGLRADQSEFGIRLLGGDTTHSEYSLTLTATLLGEVPSGEAVTRGGAVAGDDVYVSGTIGDAAIGLQRLRSGASCEDALVERFQRPTPRIALGRSLRGLVSAMADVSDGLAADLGHICTASNVSAEISAPEIPLSDRVRACMEVGDAGFGGIVSGGDDYELVFTASPANAGRIDAAAQAADVSVRRLGRVHDGPPDVIVRDAEGREIVLKQAGYRHF
ncbi:MAG: thiamine-phosphate kinase [Alphaproteobacteria bacterium]